MTTHTNDSAPQQADDFSSYSTQKLGEMLADDEQSISSRTRLLWHLRALAAKSSSDEDEMQKIINALAEGLKSSSVLLQHEICYVMGQIAHAAALPTLYDTLANDSFDVMTRHEAGEAIGAIKDPTSIAHLQNYLDHDEQVIRETCLLAIKNIENRDKKLAQDEEDISREIQSIDPTPAFSKKKTTDELARVFLDAEADLYKKYKAMFSLRNRAYRGDSDALRILCQGFKNSEGALFKHEVAFVLGQLQNKDSAHILKEVLKNEDEHPMVRHEAAEALGSICDEDSLKVLDEYQNDECLPVKHSCEVAIDMHNYWSELNNKNDEGED